ncbi:MAG: cupin domain-containing protein [Candidatus Bathyarchaeota archaeon]
MRQLNFETMRLPEDYEAAPDGSEVRPLLRVERGSLVHCVLPEDRVSRAIRHNTVEEIWYFLEGEGEVWRKLGDREEIVRVFPGTSISIPRATSFQFKNTGRGSLQFLCITMPPWPGEGEAMRVMDRWEPKVPLEI